MNLLQYLGIKIQTVTVNQVIISINVTDQLKQPFGIVHGGINATLAETAASLGANAWLTNNDRHQVATGVDINTHHLRAVKTGVLKAVATPLKLGQRIQTWQVQTFNDDQITSNSTVSLLNTNLDS
ncbi:PaaI family thioesterase [Limosilactobacillus portuensis]|jgi:1,4-dihydroxy-2-naphthoyl-CoA hydrolase|uniref:PaaI family thioesterase n=1 Tax=Limosilactobacillus portuensis TaxID=2742601 RepID=A0ABS6IXF3_9LACO|nr:PaaI family thioesterase [Limosilactobacillus portuensis]MBU9696200.1 PaaI family thioesterase [Limosilactobacillus portuensis]MDU1506498.1 PaaI family thioesterase [Limosilactobacillus vaginalis]PMC26708.1 aromatic compound catabolic protein [Gardnerella vaginalis]WCT60843.1 PaaI family thioesterase [Limosilactobacillus portuensis]